MIDLKGVYSVSEDRTKLFFGALVLLLIGLIFTQVFFPPFAVFAFILSVIFVVLSFIRPLWILFLVSLYLPFEPFFLKFINDDLYFFARFFSEGLIYLLAAVVIWSLITKKQSITFTPVSVPFMLFLIVLVSSAFINAVPPTIAVLGIRQIIRFVLVFFIAVYLRPPKSYIRMLTYVLLAIVCIQSSIGLAQSVIGAPLDELLIPSEARIFGDITVTSGTIQFWDPGSRIFATLGRYDRLGNFLYLFLFIAVAMLYEKKLKHYRHRLLVVLLLGLPALVLTFSRASWFAFLIGLIFIAVYIHRDKRIVASFLLFVMLAVGYLGVTGLRVGSITEIPGQTLVERFYESFSYSRWRGEYYGLGRMYWMVQTPLVVVPASFIFGHGPGQFGGGAVAALKNTEVYDTLGLPFGVFGADGYIDNNWFSIWGESGTLGIAFYLWAMIALLLFSVRTYRHSKDPLTRSLALGLAAMILGIGFNAFLSTILEIRTAAFYVWLYGGFVVALAHQEGLIKRENISYEHSSGE